jgi:phytoene dehydrogenase-like protein
MSPVSIRALKRFVTSAGWPRDRRLPATTASGCNQQMLPPGRGAFEPVAVVGAGVAGLTVAHDLVQLGYKVTVFEAYSEPGGMLTAGVPVFRLPRELVMAEIDAILSLGVELKCNQRLGRDFTIQPARAGLQGHLPGRRPAKGAQARSTRRRPPACTTAWIFCAPSTKATRSRWATDRRYRRRQRGLRRGSFRGSPARLSRSFDGPRHTADMHSSESVAYDVARSAVRLGGKSKSTSCA